MILIKGKRYVKKLSYSRPRGLLRQLVLFKQQKCRSYENQLKMFMDHLELELWGYSEKVVQEK